MVQVTEKLEDDYSNVNRWLQHEFVQVITKRRVMTAYWRWSNFNETPHTRSYFGYGTPPTFDVFDDGKKGCDYSDDGTVRGLLYGNTVSAMKILINSGLLQLFDDLLDEPDSDPKKLIFMKEVMEGTFTHEMVHWSYYQTGVDEVRKWYGAKETDKSQEEFGTRFFEVEAYGHPITIPFDWLCKVMTFPYLGVAGREAEEPRENMTSLGVFNVTDVDPQSPAGKAGLRANDVILQLDGEGIWFRPQTIQEQLRKTKKPGDKVTVTYRRGTITTKVDVTLAAKAKG